MNIAVIGWGSLIWDPRGLDIEPWQTDGPLLPIEFARVSMENRLTLVLLEEAPLQPTLWALSRKRTLEAAVNDLKNREGLPSERRIGRWPSTQMLATSTGVQESVANWAVAKRLDAAVWTALGPKKPDGEDGLASPNELLAYLKRLEVNGAEDAARAYVERAPAQIDTPLRRRIRDELGWAKVQSR